MSSLDPESPRRPPPIEEQPRSWWRRYGIWLVIPMTFAALLLASLLTGSNKARPGSISYAAFLDKVAAGEVESVKITTQTGRIQGVYRSGADFVTQGPSDGLPDADLALLEQHKVARSYAPRPGGSWTSALGTLLSWVLPIGLVVLAMVWLSRRMRGQQSAYMSVGRSHAKVTSATRPGTRFSDIAGYEEVKQEIREVVEFLKDPTRFRLIGARIPKGLLLVGPPGTGKTLFARAVAGEAEVAFISITASEFMEMFVGVGAARVRDLFNTAREHKPSIVFIDEIDAIGRKRGTGLGGGHDEREQTLNQILSEMDGFEAAEGIVVLAATNRPDVLDPALLRAGRFDRQVVIPLPTLEERRAILEVHCRGKRMAPDVDLDLVARGTPGMSGADLENLLNEAALHAVRLGHPAVTPDDIEAARDRVLVGQRRSSLALRPAEKQLIAYHEAGHAVLADLLPEADPVHKVTILPTGVALGATQQLPVDEHVIEQRSALEDQLAVRMGGRAAEELVFGVPSTGAHDDLTGATELATRMVREWGMSPRIGHRAWGARGPVFLGEELVHTREYSDHTAAVIDEEVTAILDAQAARALAVLKEHRPALEAVAGALLAEETVSGDRVAELVAGAGGGKGPAAVTIA